MTAHSTTQFLNASNTMEGTIDCTIAYVEAIREAKLVFVSDNSEGEAIARRWPGSVVASSDGLTIVFREQPSSSALSLARELARIMGGGEATLSAGP